MASPKASGWDGVVRLLHWALAVLVTVDLVRDDGDRFHRLIGYAAVAVVATRLTWSALAGNEAGLAGLRPSASRAWAYLRLLRHGRPPRAQGHNPLGIWMVWTIWTLVLALGVTGFMSRLDAFWGDDTVHLAHALLADGLLAAVGCHLAGVALMSWLWRENLPMAMITGCRRSNRPDLH